MHLSPNLVAGALLLAFEASATTTTKSYVTCITKQGLKPVATVKTSSRILTVPFYGFKFTTTTPTYVITPPPVTATVTATATSVMTRTQTQETDTFSETVTTTDTVLTTSTDIISVTDTATLTVTLTTDATTTIRAPADFQPIQSTFPNRKRRSASLPGVASNEAALEERGQGQRIIMNKGREPTFSPAVYPTAVACVGIAKVISTSTITRTAKMTSTVTTSAPTSSVTSTTTEVSTVTLTPIRASTTITITTGTTITQTQIEPTTTTILTTQTIEVAEPASTYYAACGPDNMISSINGKGFAYFGSPGMPQFLAVGSAYDCCAACISTPNCIGSANQVFDSRNLCLLEMRDFGACDGRSQGADVGLRDETPDGTVTISNGLCGRYFVSRG